MRTRIILIFVFAASVFSCSSEDSNTSTNAISMSITDDWMGALSVLPDSTYIYRETNASVTTPQNGLRLSASSDAQSTTSISISISHKAVPLGNSYTIGSCGLVGVTQCMSATWTNNGFWNAIAGTLNVDQWDGNSISGSYAFTLQESTSTMTRQVSGTFSGSLQVWCQNIEDPSSPEIRWVTDENFATAFCSDNRSLYF